MLLPLAFLLAGCSDPQGCGKDWAIGSDGQCYFVGEDTDAPDSDPPDDSDDVPLDSGLASWFSR